MSILVANPTNTFPACSFGIFPDSVFFAIFSMILTMAFPQIQG
jgi:hypothetical protein